MASVHAVHLEQTAQLIGRKDFSEVRATKIVAITIPPTALEGVATKALNAVGSLHLDCYIYIPTIAAIHEMVIPCSSSALMPLVASLPGSQTGERRGSVNSVG